MNKKLVNRFFLALSLLILVLIYFDSISDSHFLKNILKSVNQVNPNDTSSVTYSVQICASYGTALNADSLKNKYKLNESVKETKHHGWFKYSVGEFKNKDDARDLKNRLRKQNGLGGVFLVCFINNIRQDNLLINEITANKPENRKNENIEYRIQIKASNVRIPIDTIAKQFSLIELIKEDFEDGWYKYTIGAFDNFKSAKEFRNRIRQKKGLMDCFIVAYENDKRLSSLPHSVLKLNKVKNEPLLSNQDVKVKENKIAENKIIQRDSLLNDSLSKDTQQLKKKDYLAKDSNINFKKELNYSSNVKKKNNQRKKLIPKYMENILLMTAYTFYPADIFNIISFSVERGDHNDNLILTLFFFINFFLINFIVISVISLIILYIKTVRDNKVKLLSEQMQNLLAEYIFYEGEENEILNRFRKIAENKLQREVLMNELINFNKNLFGEAKVKLRNLYMNLKLYKDSIANARSSRWHIQAKGFRQLAQMNLDDGNNLIEKELNSSNDILSFEAQLAMVQLNHDAPFSFLDKLKKYFPLWNQLNVQMLVSINNLETPEFSKWLKSDNQYVVVFALRMIGIFQQQKAFSEIVLLLNNPNIAIRKNAIKTLGMLGLTEALIYLTRIYNNENQENKILILKALQNLPDESNLKFFGDAMLDENNIIKIEAAKGLLALGDIGRNKLQFLRMNAQVDNAEIVSIIDHTLDKRIN